MESIRITRGIEVEVNDAGETITINAEDAQFIDRFYGLINKLHDLSAKYKTEEAKGMDKPTLARLSLEDMKGLMQDIDGLFGEGCCRKVFGNIVPGPYLIADFFNKLTPICRKHGQARQREIASKYNADRMGANSGRPNRHKRRHP